MVQTITIRVCFLGDISVGKTAIIKHQMSGQPQQTENTIGADNITMIINNKELRICDTAGQEKYRSLIGGYVRDSKVIIIVFDLTKKDSYDSIKKSWITYIQEYCEPFSVLLVGNKCDLIDDREITYNDGVELSCELKNEFYKPIPQIEKQIDDKRYYYFETSAIDGRGIQDLFNSIESIAYAAQQYCNNNNAVQINPVPDEENRKQKCPC